MRALLVFFLQSVILSALAQNATQDFIKTWGKEWALDTSIDKHATYEKGERALVTTFMKTIQFPPSEGSECTTNSKIIMAVMINEFGDVQQVKVVRSICPPIDTQCVNVMKGLKFKPAIKQGKPVKDVFYFPIQICLR